MTIGSACSDCEHLSHLVEEHDRLSVLAAELSDPRAAGVKTLSDELAFVARSYLQEHLRAKHGVIQEESLA